MAWTAALAGVLAAGLAGCGPRPPDATRGGGADRPGQAASSGPAADAPVVLDRYPFGGEFQLTRHDGRPFRLSDGRGRVQLLFFGFTRCPDVCPLTLSRVARALNQLTAGQRNDVSVLFATVDVDRDTPGVLAAYLKGLPMPVTGLTGARADVDRVVGAYKATYEITPSDSAGGPSVSHSTYLYLIDRAGAVRQLFRMSDPPERIAAGLRLALAEPWPDARPATDAGASR